MTSTGGGKRHQLHFLRSMNEEYEYENILSLIFFESFFLIPYKPFSHGTIGESIHN